MGIRWQTPDDVQKIGTRIKNTDEPRFARFFKVREYVVERLRGGYLGKDEPDFYTGSATNDVLEFVANLESDLAFQLPEAEVTTGKSGAAYAAARGSNHALNQWMHETRYELQERQSALNYMVGYSVRARGLAPKGPKEDGIDWPWSKEVPTQRFGWDTDAPMFQEKEYAYQLHEEYQHDLLERARRENGEMKEGEPGRWNVELIEQLKDAPGGADIIEQIKGIRRPTEGKLQWFHIYLPNADASELLSEKEAADYGHLYHGVMLSVVADPGGQVRQPGFLEIREPVPYFGPPQGPYTLIGMQAIPDESIPASVLLLTIGQSIEFNAIVAANNRASREWANLIFVDDRRLAKLIESGKHNTVYYKAALSKDAIVNVPKGGLNEQVLAQEERAERIYYRSVGLTDAERGASEGGITATQDAIVSGAATKRRDGQVNTFHLGIEEDLYGVLWLLYHTDTVIVEQGPEAVDEFKAAAPVFFGGKHDPEQVRRYFERYHPEVEITPEMLKAQPEIPFSDLALRVRVGSMGRKTKAERLLDASNELLFLSNFYAALIQFPFWPVDTAKRWAARKSGIIEIPDMVDNAWVELMRGLMIQAQVPPAEPEAGASMGRSGPRTVEMPGGAGKRPVQAKPQNMQPMGAAPSSQGVRNGMGAMQGAA